MSFLSKVLKCRSNNNFAVWIAIYCSMPWMFNSNAGGHHRPMQFVLLAGLTVVVAVLATIASRRKCRTAL